MKKKIIAAIVCMLMIGTIILTATGQLLEPVTVNQNKNVFLNDNIDDFILNEMNKSHYAGLSASIVRNDRVTWTKSYGYANISQNLLVIDTTLFMLASISKTITATAIMQLYEKDYFDLNDSINDYLPFAVVNPNFPATNITFHMLLTHSSSIQDNWNAIPYHDGDPIIPLGQYFQDYLTPGGAYYDPNLNFYNQKPGTAFHYCNVAAALVGYLVERISGLPFDEYCLINIFEPLQMDETAWFLADLNINHIAVPYHWNGTYIPYQHYSIDPYPCAMLRTSITQLDKFLLMMMNNGTYNSTEILNKSTVNLMLTLQLTYEQHIGIIWQKWPFYGRTVWGHAGSDFGVLTYMFFEPKTHIGINILTNGESDNVDDLDPILNALFNYAETSNQPPNSPTITGPAKAKIKVATTYNFTTSDPENDQVYYFIDWGDGTNSSWIGSYLPGDVITQSHTWSKKETYIIKAKAKDNFGNESDWATLQVKIPRISSINNLILRFFENHLLLYKIFQLIFRNYNLN